MVAQPSAQCQIGSPGLTSALVGSLWAARAHKTPFCHLSTLKCSGSFCNVGVYRVKGEEGMSHRHRHRHMRARAAGQTQRIVRCTRRRACALKLHADDCKGSIHMDLVSTLGEGAH
eukprot:1158227-Pelagomonas_calceolata.AAC.6